ncbi:putative BsuMI modification methylase subunit YdiP [invertebrate metagenome]|uniref:Putative BsuMI modification methylase subunit YdiP n=1 Tax=invertebrate metagenome TaxID=1711999 RepID=A0A2H9TBV2_9ZZZZ
MRYLSLFSGIEAATVAWQRMGWECAGLSEIEPFPCALLKHYYPSVPNLGDITQIKESQVRKLGPIDLVVFGSPCQDLSLAGKRRGLSGERSSLFRDAVRVIKWARKHNGCRFALWENVPGTFSSNKGRDFSEVLRHFTGTELHQPERWRSAGVAFGKAGHVEWRVLDAQYFGVPQRRRRLFAFVDFGDWTSRSPVLFESEGMYRDTEACEKTGQDIAGTLEARTRAGGFPGTDGACANHIIGTRQWPADKTCTLPAVFAEKCGLEDQHIDGGASLFVPARGVFDRQAYGNYGENDVSSTLSRRDYKDVTDLVVYGEAIHPHCINRKPENGPQSDFNGSGIGYTMGAPQAVVYPIHDKATRYAGKRGDKQDGAGNGLGISAEGAPMNTLTAGDKHAVFYCGTTNDAFRDHANNLAPTLRSGNNGGAVHPAVCSETVVRRLTPKECERLQGFPDDYTRIPYRKRPEENCPDSPRYKALGNSMAVPVMYWIGRRIENVLGSDDAP